MEDLANRYVKKNNIGSYLDLDLDMQGLLNEMTEEEYKEMQREIKEEYKEEEEYIDEIINDYNYYYIAENEDIGRLINLINGCEFKIIINDIDNLKLEDMQGGYLGGIESYENFKTIKECAERLECSFFKDYFGIEVY